ncbi:flagellar biosynthetic protein FliO [Cellvibrio sp. UBA7661]|uniref:flagellar biosynthetic protein FliO n=1 Tax=Cellvibrio sp. UBA7661 TaxID=1946311 RepID=UPI002F359B34
MSVSPAALRTEPKNLIKKWKLAALLFICIIAAPCYADDSSVSQQAAQTTSIDAPSPSSTAEPVASTAMQHNTQQNTQQNTSAAAVTPFYEKSAASPTAITGAPGVGSGGHLLNVTLGLLLIVGLIFALSFFVKRFGAGSFAGNGQLKVLSSMPLGTRERIVLIDAAGQQLLLGITPTHINTLHVFTEPVVLNNTNTASSDFSKTLMSLLQPKKNAANPHSGSQSINNNNPAA